MRGRKPLVTAGVDVQKDHLEYQATEWDTARRRFTTFSAGGYLGLTDLPPERSTMTTPANAIWREFPAGYHVDRIRFPQGADLKISALRPDGTEAGYLPAAEASAGVLWLLAQLAAAIDRGEPLQVRVDYTPPTAARDA